jgi:HSP20 family protein
MKRGPETNLPMWRDFFNVGSFFDDNWFSRFENKLPAVNISENENEYNLEVVVPGFKKEDIKVKIEDNLLTISAESKAEAKEGDKKEFTRREYAYSAFTRTFHLPENVKDDNLEAHYENGILAIKIPKSQNQTKHSTEVPII